MDKYKFCTENKKTSQTPTPDIHLPRSIIAMPMPMPFQINAEATETDTPGQKVVPSETHLSCVTAVVVVRARPRYQGIIHTKGVLEQVLVVLGGKIYMI